MALPDTAPSIISLSPEHGPSFVDGLGIVGLLAGFGVLLGVVLRRRAALTHSLKTRPWLLAGLAFLWNRQRTCAGRRIHGLSSLVDGGDAPSARLLAGTCRARPCLKSSPDATSMADPLGDSRGSAAERGQQAKGFLTVPGVDVQIPVAIVNGAAPGPRLAVTAGPHGAECPCIEGAIRFSRVLNPAEMTGSVVSVPVCRGCQGDRGFPPDGGSLRDTLGRQERGLLAPLADNLGGRLVPDGG